MTRRSTLQSSALQHALSRVLKSLVFCSPLLMAACSHPNDTDALDPPASCSMADQQTWLQSYFDDQYYFTDSSPKSVAQSTDLQSFFDALLYTGGDDRYSTSMTDVWSEMSSDESYRRYYGAGDALGYGVFVSGIESQSQPTQALYVRHVDPGSPAAALGISRGDQVLALNGVSATDLIARNDFGALQASSAGQTLVIDLRSGGTDKRLTLLASVYDLLPVQGTQVIAGSDGRKVGYLMVTDMLDQARSAYDAAFAQFQAAGAQDLILDLRYNSGGYMAVSAMMASYLNSSLVDKVYGTLTFNSKHPEQNGSYYFGAYDAALALGRVYVLTGPRTCGAAEQLINGLAPHLPTVLVGSASCGKPFGATAVSACGTTYSALTYQVSNANQQTTPLQGMTPTCAVSEDFTQPVGGSSDPLVAAALQHASTGICPASASTAAASELRSEPNLRRGLFR